MQTDAGRHNVRATIGGTLMPLQFTLCDVFADRPFTGNQLAVFLDATGASDETMAGIAQEFGWSEVAYVVPGGDAPPRVRIWTPHGELTFAGHPTIGTAVVLAVSGVFSASDVALELGIGRIDIHLEALSATGGTATMVQRAPRFGAILEDRGRIADALSLVLDELAPDLESQIVSTGSAHLMVPVSSAGALARATPVRGLLRDVLSEAGARRAYLFSVDTPGTNAAARARLLDEGFEDAATGSAAGALGAYLVRYGLHRGGVLDVEQGIELGRPSRISVNVPVRAQDIGPVSVTGNVRIWGHGSVEVDM